MIDFKLFMGYAFRQTDSLTDFREAFKKKKPNIWKFPYVGGRGGSGRGPFPYVFTIVPKCILSHFKPF